MRKLHKQEQCSWEQRQDRSSHWQVAAPEGSTKLSSIATVAAKQAYSVAPSTSSKQIAIAAEDTAVPIAAGVVATAARREAIVVVAVEGSSSSIVAMEFVTKWASIEPFSFPCQFRY